MVEYFGETIADTVVKWLRRPGGSVPPGSVTGTASEPGKPLVVGASDDSLAATFIDRHGHDLLYVSTGGKWTRWAGTHWKPEKVLAAFDLARMTCREILATKQDNAHDRS